MHGGCSCADYACVGFHICRVVLLPARVRREAKAKEAAAARAAKEAAHPDSPSGSQASVDSDDSSASGSDGGGGDDGDSRMDVDSAQGPVHIHKPQVSRVLLHAMCCANTHNALP